MEGGAPRLSNLVVADRQEDGWFYSATLTGCPVSSNSLSAETWVNSTTGGSAHLQAGMIWPLLCLLCFTENMLYFLTYPVFPGVLGAFPSPG